MILKSLHEKKSTEYKNIIDLLSGQYEDSIRQKLNEEALGNQIQQSTEEMPQKERENQERESGEKSRENDENLTEPGSKKASEGIPMKKNDENAGDIENKFDHCYLTNAGLILLTPYFPTFFKSLGLISEGKIKDVNSQMRAVHLIQYLVNQDTSSPEHLVILNKILCGLELSVPLVKGIEISTKEKNYADSLLNSVITNWSALKDVSRKGFRASFLVRNGILEIKENEFLLRVERKAYDILLDTIPWTYSRIKLSWMKKPVITEW